MGKGGVHACCSGAQPLVEPLLAGHSVHGGGDLPEYVFPAHPALCQVERRVGDVGPEDPYVVHYVIEPVSGDLDLTGADHLCEHVHPQVELALGHVRCDAADSLDGRAHPFRLDIVDRAEPLVCACDGGPDRRLAFSLERDVGSPDEVLVPRPGGSGRDCDQEALPVPRGSGPGRPVAEEGGSKPARQSAEVSLVPSLYERACFQEASGERLIPVVDAEPFRRVQVEESEPHTHDEDGGADGERGHHRHQIGGAQEVLLEEVIEQIRVERPGVQSGREDALEQQVRSYPERDDRGREQAE